MMNVIIKTVLPNFGRYEGNYQEYEWRILELSPGYKLCKVRFKHCLMDHLDNRRM
jgi:hypothetical protein